PAQSRVAARPSGGVARAPDLAREPAASAARPAFPPGPVRAVSARRGRSEGAIIAGSQRPARHQPRLEAGLSAGQTWRRLGGDAGAARRDRSRRHKPGNCAVAREAGRAAGSEARVGAFVPDVPRGNHQLLAAGRRRDRGALVRQPAFAAARFRRTGAAGGGRDRDFKRAGAERNQVVHIPPGGPPAGGRSRVQLFPVLRPPGGVRPGPRAHARLTAVCQHLYGDRLRRAGIFESAGAECHRFERRHRCDPEPRVLRHPDHAHATPTVTPIPLVATGSMTGRWRPAPVVRCSMMLHAAGAIALAVQPVWWPWVLGALAGNHLVLIAAALWPRGRWLGPNLTRLPASAIGRHEVALTFDDGPDPEVTPRVLEL